VKLGKGYNMDVDMDSIAGVEIEIQRAET